MSRLSRAIPGCVLLAAIVGVTAAHGQESPKAARALSQYTSKAWRWTISYPAGWAIDSKNPELVRIHSAAQHALCTFFSGPVDRFNTVDELANFLLEHDGKFFKSKGLKFTVLARKKITLPGGVAGNDVQVEIEPGVRSRRIYVLADGRGLAVDCETETKNWSKLEASYQGVIASFTVRK